MTSRRQEELSTGEVSHTLASRVHVVDAVEVVDEHRPPRPSSRLSSVDLLDDVRSPGS